MYRINNYLVINDAREWHKAKKLSTDSRFGLGIGYREYSYVTVYNVCSLYESDFMNCIGAINSAMKYPGILWLDIRKINNYKLFPDQDRLVNLVRGKGFNNIEINEYWIRAQK